MLYSLGTTCPHVVSFQYKTCKDGSVLGVTVTRIALLTHCQALTQACGYTEGMGGTLIQTLALEMHVDSGGIVLFPLLAMRVVLRLHPAQLTVHLLDCLVSWSAWAAITNTKD